MPDLTTGKVRPTPPPAGLEYGGGQRRLSEIESTTIAPEPSDLEKDLEKLAVARVSGGEVLFEEVRTVVPV